MNKNSFQLDILSSTFLELLSTVQKGGYWRFLINLSYNILAWGISFHFNKFGYQVVCTFLCIFSAILIGLKCGISKGLYVGSLFEVSHFPLNNVFLNLEPKSSEYGGYCCRWNFTATSSAIDTAKGITGALSCWKRIFVLQVIDVDY